jgi:hypothetical protein
VLLCGGSCTNQRFGPHTAAQLQAKTYVTGAQNKPLTMAVNGNGECWAAYNLSYTGTLSLVLVASCPRGWNQVARLWRRALPGPVNAHTGQADLREEHVLGAGAPCGRLVSLTCLAT